MPMQSRRLSSRISRRALLGHLLRISLLAAILLLIHERYRQRSRSEGQSHVKPAAISLIESLFPTSKYVMDKSSENAVQIVRDSSGEVLGQVILTDSQKPPIVGFSGPSLCLIGLDPEDRVTGIRLLSSEDTPAHVEQIRRDPGFLAQFDQLSRQEARTTKDVDVVSGATLTSMAIVESIQRSLGGTRQSLRFPAPLSVHEVQEVFPDTRSLDPDPAQDGLFRILDDLGQEIGRVLRTSPVSDQQIGFQGPQDVAVYLDREGRIETTRLRSSYDNEPYVGYVQEEQFFLDLFQGRGWSELNQHQTELEQVEGVSGATMTSQAVAAAVFDAARAMPTAGESEPTLTGSTRTEAVTSFWQQLCSEGVFADSVRRDLFPLLFTILGILISLQVIRARGPWRTVYQVGLIGGLGFLYGDLLSQATLAGWTQSGIPWRRAPGLVFLTFSAILIPAGTGRQAYCQHLCAHGAIQQQMLRLGWRRSFPRRLRRFLRIIPFLLLLWVLFVSLSQTEFSLVDIEPFDAYVPQIAGWATLSIFVVSLVVSAFYPMAYCRYGCPTGAVLGWLRFHRRSDRSSHRDLAALICLGFALFLFLSS